MATTKKFLDQDGLTNVFTTVDKWCKVSGGGAFDEIDNTASATISETGPSGSTYKVVFNTTLKKFAAKNGSAYHGTWGDSDSLSGLGLRASGGGVKPIEGKLYLCKSTKEIYVCKGGTLEKAVSITPPAASASEAGVVKVGAGLTSSSGTLSVNAMDALDITAAANAALNG